jgi:hypothetical protein
MPNQHNRNESKDDMPKDNNGSTKSSQKDVKGNGQGDKKFGPAMGFLGDTATGNVPRDTKPK